MASDIPTVRISVITVCFNAAATIEHTIESVLAQQDADIEYIVVDGLSNDGTLAIVDRYRSRIDRVVSEKDAGIFDAMNKGIALATGEVLYFLNADDTLVDARVLHDIAATFSEDEGRLLVYGNVIFQGAPEGMFYGPAKAFKQWTVGEFLDNSFCHQALFARRSLFDEVGHFDCRSKYAADYEWVIKVFKLKPTGFHYVPRDIANYFYFGRSQTQSAVTRREVRTFYLKYFRTPGMAWFYLRYVVLRGWKKRLFREQW